MIFFSKTTSSFYDSDLHGEDSLPIDSLAITLERHRELMAEQAKGKRIVAGEDGFPTVVDQASPSLDAIKSKLKLEASKLLDAEARSLGFNGMTDALSFTTDESLPTMRDEAKKLLKLRSKVYDALIKKLEALKEGQLVNVKELVNTAKNLKS